MRSHGGGQACYRGFRPETGTCIPCRIVGAIRKHPVNLRYRRTALGMLSDLRHHAKRRQG